MYLVNFLDGEKQFSLFMQNIIYHQGKLALIINEKDITEDVFLTATKIQICIKNHLGGLSEILFIEPNNISFSHKTIHILPEEKLSNPHIFKHIELMLKQQSRAWQHYSENEKYQWLRSCYFYNRNHHTYHKSITIDGKFITTKNGFLCEFAEQLIGIGGYFGSDLDGFDDCFGMYQVRDICVLWQNFDYGDFELKSVIIDILKYHEAALSIS